MFVAPRWPATHTTNASTMTELALKIGSALVAFGPLVSIFSMVVYQKSQLVIVVTSSAFFFLLAAVCASLCWRCFYAIGLRGPLSAMIPGVVFQFLFRCSFVALYHRVEAFIQTSVEKSAQYAQEHDTTMAGPDGASNDTVAMERTEDRSKWNEAAKLRLALNDAACGIAAGVGFGGMHAVMLFGTLLASQVSNSVGILYQQSCPAIPSLAVSAINTFLFFILDMFWMLFTFFGMRRRLICHRGETLDDDTSVGGWFGNSRTGGNVSLLLCLLSHFVSSVFTSANYFDGGCVVSLPVLGGITLLTAYLFWAGVGRIYMPPSGRRAIHED